MRKLLYALAALIAIATPTIASAEGFGVYIGGDRYYPCPRVQFYGRDRGWHRGWYHRGYDYGDRGVSFRRQYWHED